MRQLHKHNRNKNQGEAYKRISIIFFNRPAQTGAHKKL